MENITGKQWNSVILREDAGEGNVSFLLQVGYSGLISNSTQAVPV